MLTMNFWYGVIVGMAFLVGYSYMLPLGVVPVQQELVKLNHGYFDSTTKEFKLKECK